MKNTHHVYKYQLLKIQFRLNFISEKLNCNSKNNRHLHGPIIQQVYFKQKLGYSQGNWKEFSNASCKNQNLKGFEESSM